MAQQISPAVARRSPQPVNNTHMVEFGFFFSNGGTPFSLKFGASFEGEKNKANGDIKVMAMVWQKRLQEALNDPTLRIQHLREGSLITICTSNLPLAPIAERISHAYTATKKLPALEGFSWQWGQGFSDVQWYKPKDLPLIENILKSVAPPPPMLLPPSQVPPAPLQITSVPQHTVDLGDCIGHLLTPAERQEYLAYATGVSASSVIKPRDLERQQFEAYLKSQNMLERFQSMPGWENDWYEVAALLLPKSNTDFGTDQ